MKRLWIAVVLASACGDDGGGTGGGSEDTSVAEGGPCGFAGGPLVRDELHTPLIGSDAAGTPTVIVELHEAGTCNGEPAAAVATVAFDRMTGMITVGSEAVEITTPADYRDERYYWDDLAIYVELVHTETDVTITYYQDKNTPMVVCVPATMAVDCS